MAWAVAVASVAARGQAPADQPGLVPGGANESRSRILPLTERGRTKARALALYFEGLRLARRKDPASSIERYLEVLRLDPRNLRLAKRLADTYVLAGRLDDALAVLENAVRANPDRPAGYIFLSEFCARHHNNSDAVKARGFAAAKEAVERFPDHAAVHGNLAALLLLDGERTQAAGVIERAIARDERNPDFWIGLAGPASQVWPPRDPANRDRVLALYRKAQELAPAASHVLEGTADFLAGTGGVAEAVPLYREVVSQRPDDLKAREKLAHSLALSGQSDASAAVWKDLLSVDPQSASAHQALARYFAAKGDRHQSVRHRAEALRWGDEESLREALRLVNDMLAVNLPRDALAVLERAEFNTPASPDPPYLAALAHLRLDEAGPAAAAFARAAAAAGADEENGPLFLTEGFFYEWGMACARAGQPDEAEKKFREAISRVPKSTPELAAKSYNALAFQWLEHDRQIAEAGPLIERALKLDPENAAYLDTLGWFHFKKGDPAKAVEVLHRAEAAAENPIAEIIDHRAQALWALGQKTNAIAALAQAAALADATDAMKQRLADWQAAAAK